MLMVYGDEISKLQGFKQDSRSLLISATVKVVEKFIINYFGALNVISSAENFNALDFKDEFLARTFLNYNIVVRQELVSTLTVLPDERRRRGVVFLIENFEDFNFVMSKMSPDLFEFNGIYLIVLISGRVSKVQDMFRLLWKSQVYNVVVLYEAGNNTIPIKTFIPFSPGNCNDVTPTLIDEFRNGKFVKGENLFPKKLKNLNNCTLRVSISNTTQPFVVFNNGSSALTGGDISLLNALAESLSFSIDYVVATQGYLYENGSSEGPLRSLQYGKVDMSISCWWLKTHRLLFFDSTVSYLSDHIMFVIPSGEDLTTLEELAFPFKLDTWLFILACFIVGSLVIFITKRRPKTAQNFVFGRGVHHPYLNMLIAFSGQGQTVLPKRNFARFLLMLFLMYSMVIRTVYQGLFFILLQSNKHHKEIQSIDEMIQKDFTFYAVKGNTDMIDGTEAMRER